MDLNQQLRNLPLSKLFHRDPFPRRFSDLKHVAKNRKTEWQDEDYRKHFIALTEHDEMESVTVLHMFGNGYVYAGQPEDSLPAGVRIPLGGYDVFNFSQTISHVLGSRKPDKHVLKRPWADAFVSIGPVEEHGETFAMEASNGVYTNPYWGYTHSFRIPEIRLKRVGIILSDYWRERRLG